MHGKAKIVLAGKDVYYKNMVLFIQRLQNLVTFKKLPLWKPILPHTFEALS